MPGTERRFRARDLIGFAALALLLAGCGKQDGPVSRSEAAKNSSAMWERVGTELATLAAAQSPEGRILLIRDPEQEGLVNGHREMAAAFQRAFPKKSPRSCEVVTVETPPVPMPELVGIDSGPRPLSRAWLDAALTKNGPAVLIVSLVGEPAGAAPAGGPRIVCFARDGGTNLAAAMKSGSVVGAVAPRHTNPPDNEQDWFELRYTVLTPANIAAW